MTPKFAGLPLLLILASVCAQADDPEAEPSPEPVSSTVLGPYVQAIGEAVAVEPSALGLEAGIGLLFQPIAEHEFWVGPRVSALWAQGGGITRFDINTGIEGTLWIANGVGPGLGLDWVAPSSITGDSGSTSHFRVDPQLTIRVLHFENDGAWAVRLGIPYDTQYRWGFQAGVVLEFNGVPTL